MRDFLAALALALVIEGILYFAFPDGMRRMLTAVAGLPPMQIRLAALAVALVGLVMIWVVRRGVA